MARSGTPVEIRTCWPPDRAAGGRVEDSVWTSSQTLARAVASEAQGVQVDGDVRRSFRIPPLGRCEIVVGPGWWRGGLIGVLVVVAAVVLLFGARCPRDIFDLVVGLNRWIYRVIP